MSIEAQSLTKAYGNQLALNAVSFSAKKGEIVGFLGPNGAGKSTCMKILTAFMPPSTGLAKVNGYDVVKESLKVRKSTGYLPELNPLYFEMYVHEYLHFSCRLKKINGAKNAISEVIEKTGLTVEQNKKIGQLSKGYKQRVGLAQAILGNPQTLILDEPTSGLDPNQVVEIRALIKEIGKDKTVLLSSHIMPEVEAMCSRVIIINKGKMVIDESLSELKNKQKNKNYWLVKFNKSIEMEKLKQHHFIENCQATASENTFQIQSNAKDFSLKMFKLAEENGLNIVTIEENKKTLEQVFQELTNA